MRGSSSSRLVRHSIMNDRPAPFAPAIGSSVLDRLRIGGVAAVLVDAPADRNLLAAIGRAHDLAVGDHAGGEVEQIRPAVPARHRERDRIGRHRRDPRARIDHHRAGRAHDDAGEARLRRLQREIADRAGVGDVARRAPADMPTSRAAVHRLVHRTRHARPRTARGRLRAPPRRLACCSTRMFGRGVDRLGLDQIDVARDADDAVRVGAAQVGPDQHLRPFVGVLAA